jgi:C-terminal four TMM region of protein-O-mannosyltransferase/Dolichyl-phosphate-mannose-protein mannosyltransferase
LSGPAIGEPDPDGAAPARTGLWDAAGGILVVLALGLTFRLIIAYLLPGSGFKVDLQAFQYWADNLADHGIFGFYARAADPQTGFFADYTPGYLYVLWLVGNVGNLVGGIGDLIKIPPIVADLALAYLVWSMTRELGGSERAARIGAVIVVANPVTWFDSVVWGQVDSFGVVFLLLGLRELWRDRPERSAVFTMLAALIKPQLGILIPLVAVVVIRRALSPRGAFGLDDADQPAAEPAPGTTGLEQRIRGPIRILTTGVAGFLTAVAASIPFGLSIPGLIAQIFKTAGGYPYLSVNAFNPWALVVQQTADGRDQSVALTRSWLCDSTVLASGPSEFRIGPFVIPELGSAGTATDLCPNGVMIGAFPAVLVGAALFVLVAVAVLWFVGRRPDRMTTLVGLAVLSLAFFVLPTRVHERYLFPLVAVGAILAAVSLRWRIAYLLSAAATFANMYVVLAVYYPDNPGIHDWLGTGEAFSSAWGIAIAALTQAAVLGWTFLQLRGDAVEGLEEQVAAGRAREVALAEVPIADDELDPDRLWPQPAVVPGRALPGWASAFAGPLAAEPAPLAIGAAGGGAGAGEAVAPSIAPYWAQERDAGTLGPWGWLRARLGDSPVRADRSRTLEGERGGRLDRLDVWVLVVLAISLMTVRMWRLDEPYSMHFDEVYHPRTATEFLQDWRYGISHDIYEWTHPHLAKYAMALGLVALGEDRVSATSELGTTVVDAVIEPRRDDGLNASRVEGDRLWVATGTAVRAYDLATRELAGTLDLPDAVALAYDSTSRTLYVATRGGEIRAVDTTALDVGRRGPPQAVESRAYLSVGGPVRQLFVGWDDDVLAAVLEPGFGQDDPASSTIVVIDVKAAVELARPSLPGVTQLTMGYSDHRIAVGTANGVAFIDPVTGIVSDTLDIGGPVHGLAGINNISGDPLFATTITSDGPRLVALIAERGEKPHKDNSMVLPGARAGRVYYDRTSRMVHVEGSVQDTGPDGPDTVYVVEPHADVGAAGAIYADAELPFVPAVMVMDENEQYPSTDREQLLALDSDGGVASVEIGRHAYAWRVPGVLAGVGMALLLYVLARLLFKRRSVAVLLGIVTLVDGMLFAQSRIGMNDSYVGLGIVAAYTIFTALWLHPGGSRRHWIAFALGVPLIGFFLGFALASKWVAAYAIGGLGILVLVRSALGRLLLVAGLLLLATVLGYVAISVPEGQTGGNYVFLLIMIAIVVVAVLANTLHPVAWTMEELWFAVGVPAALGALALLYGLSRGDAAAPLELGPVSASPLALGFAGLVAAGAVYLVFLAVGRYGFGPLAPPPEPDDPAAILEPPSDAPVGWLRLGSGFGLPAIWLAVGLLVIPIGLYVVSYLPWAFVENHQILGGATPGTGWPPLHTGQTLLDLTSAMYNYHNTLSAAHPASSPWWAWTLDLKPVWFYEEGFAGGTSASIYDAGNLVAWWLAVPALGFVAWQAFRRRSAALALIAIGFACQWISWGRIDRAAFQYHYYTALPFVFLALAYFLSELWHGTSRRIWLLARISAAVCVMGPFLLWLFHRPLCALVRVTDIVPSSQACPTLIPDVTITPRAVAIAVVMGVGVLLLVRELLSLADEGDADRLADEQASGGWRGALARFGLGSRWATAAFIGLGTTVAFMIVSTVLQDTDGIQLTGIPVEPIAVVVLLALSPVAAYVATARDSRRFVLGAIGAMVFWFILWYPNISALPLPSALHNAYQGFLPTYLYPFQFWVLQGDRAPAPPLFARDPGLMLLALTFMALVVAYSAWSWRIALAERRRDLLAAPDDGRSAAPAS